MNEQLTLNGLDKWTDVSPQSALIRAPNIILTVFVLCYELKAQKPSEDNQTALIHQRQKYLLNKKVKGETHFNSFPI